MKIIIDTPKWSFTKYNDDGSIDYVSPIPCPFNYGRILGMRGKDGDEMDALLLGKKVKKGTVIEVKEVGIVRFLDDGEEDDKRIFSDREPTFGERVLLFWFFRLFSFLKWAKNKKDGKRGRTGLVEIINQ